jgi:hypothetical protein
VAERRAKAAINRAQAHRARTETRSWIVQRRERTHRLIELGGLVEKAGLPILMADDRATLYGALLSLADQLAEAPRTTTLDVWRRRGRRAFDAEARSQPPKTETPR